MKRAVRFAAPVAIVAATTLTAPRAEADFYLKIPDGIGDVTTPGFEGWADVLAWSWGLERPADPLGGRTDLSVGEISIVKKIDGITGVLHRTLVTGSIYPQVELVSTRPTSLTGGESEVVRLTLENVVITSNQQGGRDGQVGAQTESIAITFSKYSMVVSTYDIKGKVTTQTVTYDIAKGTGG